MCMYFIFHIYIFIKPKCYYLYFALNTSPLFRSLSLPSVSNFQFFGILFTSTYRTLSRMFFFLSFLFYPKHRSTTSVTEVSFSGFVGGFSVFCFVLTTKSINLNQCLSRSWWNLFFLIFLPRRKLFAVAYALRIFVVHIYCTSISTVKSIRLFFRLY